SDQRERGQVYDEAHAWYSANWDPSMPLGEWWTMLAETGWGYPFWPAGRFGKGFSHVGALEADRARDDIGAFGPPNGVGVTLVAPTLFEHGPELLLDRYLRSIATGEELWCQLFSEPGAGSDLAGLHTTAVRDGDEWVINGQKVWTTGGHTAQRAVVMARTDAAVSKHQGISFFCMELDQPGVEVRPLRDMTGDSEFNEVFMDDARVRHDDAIGGVNNGWRAAMTMLAVERELDAVGHDGGGDVVNVPDLTMAVGAAQSEQQTGADISGFSYTTGAVKDQVVADLLADVDRRDPVLRQAMAAARIDREVLDWNGAREVHPSLGKLGNSLLCRSLRDLGFSGRGMDAQLGRADAVDGGHFLKTALFTQGMAIAGGTDEIQRNLIGERELGLPKEPDPTRGMAFNDLPL
ncbi:MAG: acyl-CoA dehydrogenase family protein, partial [Actinomycetota bacterium]|nr:acyl-CoA dehydrogenase family protein [Actinomycetota bacterium]